MSDRQLGIQENMFFVGDEVLVKFELIDFCENKNTCLIKLPSGALYVMSLDDIHSVYGGDK